MPSLNPSPEQLADYVAAMPSGVPILMLNLLRYNAQATYPPGSPHSPCSGREAYARYSRVALTKVQAGGGAISVAWALARSSTAPPEEE
ncbi:DUF1330 domain-containing protein, partial [Stutzerimonas stutzeri]|uniref:DUF1330 domain-containing protein n=1 Tax=Stutzerimonas stutzeri TaxID=316 RepID=UPI0024B648E3